MATDPTMAVTGRSLKQRAAAGGPIIRAKIRRSPIEGSIGEKADQAQHRHRQDLARADQPHDKGERRDHVGPAPSAERPDAEGGKEGEDTQADQGVNSDEIRAGGAGEGPLGDGMGRERRTPEHDEEADHPSDDSSGIESDSNETHG